MDDIDHTIALNTEPANEEEDSNANPANDVNSNVCSSFKEYCSNIYFVTELLLCILLAGLGHNAPKLIFQMSLIQREIPYQQTANGDIILDQYINRELTQQETIPDWLLVLLCAIIPFFIMLLFSFFLGYKHDLHSSACFFLFALGSSEFITNFVKLYVGYWRPNFYNYCGFNADNMDCEAENENASNDARKSFPSGHASGSFCGMTSITLFFLGKIGLFCSHHYSFRLESSRSSSRRMDLVFSSRNNEVTASILFKRRIMSMIATSPMFLAVFIAASRVHDDMHHPADVVAGAVIGMCCAIFSYRLW